MNESMPGTDWWSEGKEDWNMEGRWGRGRFTGGQKSFCMSITRRAVVSGLRDGIVRLRTEEKEKRKAMRGDKGEAIYD
jgi:hypothetical protein